MVKIGIIGTQSEVKKYNAFLLRISGIEIIGNHINTTENKKSIYDLEPTNLSELFTKCDTLVFTKNCLHAYELIAHAIKNSKNLYFHPSLLTSIDQISYFIKLAGETNVVLHVETPLRYHAALKNIKNRLKNVRCINIENHLSLKHNYWSETILGALLNNLDIINSVIRSNVKNIRACGLNISNGGIDILNTWLEFDDGKIAYLSCSKVAEYAKHTASFVQKDRVMNINFLTNETSILFPNENNLYNKQESIKNAIDNNSVDNNPVLGELMHFIHTINNKSKLLSAYEESFKSIFIAKKILRKVENVLVYSN